MRLAFAAHRAVLAAILACAASPALADGDQRPYSKEPWLDYAPVLYAPQGYGPGLPDPLAESRLASSKLTGDRLSGIGLAPSRMASSKLAFTEDRPARAVYRQVAAELAGGPAARDTADQPKAPPRCTPGLRRIEDSVLPQAYCDLKLVKRQELEGAPKPQTRAKLMSTGMKIIEIR